MLMQISLALLQKIWASYSVEETVKCYWSEKSQEGRQETTQISIRYSKITPGEKEEKEEEKERRN
jgi:hypothetical protein